jgi:hypothetical protein
MLADAPTSILSLRARGIVAHVKTLVVLLLTIATSATPARAQLLSSLSQQRDLSFGTILTGTSTTVAPTSPGAAMWKIHGILSVSGGITFTLPSTLTIQGGSTTLPISFSSTSAIYNVGSSNPATGTTFNPATGKALVVSVLSDIYIWLGATANPPLNQKAGTYQGTVVLTVAGMI